MKIGYNIPDMTHLRYYIPLIKALRRAVPGMLHEFVIVGGPSKYNSVQRAGNFEKFVEIMNNHDISFKHAGSDDMYDVAFTVEGYCCGIKGHKSYAIQHGFDYHNNHPCLPGMIHVMSAQEYADDLSERKPGRETLVSPCPITTWEFDFKSRNPLNEINHVTIFYPENGLHDLVGNVIAMLRSADRQVHIKQRAKNQAVPEFGVPVYYDRDWYPSESIYLPAMSDVCIGFGTAAYTDLVHAGINFIDVPIPNYSREYIKPKHSCMMVLDSSASAEQIVEAAVRCRRNPAPIDVEAIDGFVRGLL